MNVEELTASLDLDRFGEALVQSSGTLLLILIGALTASIVSRRLVSRIDDDRIRAQLDYFVPKLVVLLTAVAIVGAIGVDVSGMAAVLATIGLTGAVVFTPIGQNFVAGAMVRIDDVYDIGDAITVNGLNGRVVHRSLLRTELELPDGSKAWVPNAMFQDGEVLNHSRLGGWRIRVQIPLDRSGDRRRAQAIMDRVTDELPWNQPGKRAFVAFDHVGGEAMFFNVYAWIADRNTEPYYRGLLLDALVDALEEVGVSVGQTTNLAIRPEPELEGDAVTADA